VLSHSERLFAAPLAKLYDFLFAVAGKIVQQQLVELVSYLGINPTLNVLQPYRSTTILYRSVKLITIETTVLNF
jgi:hypothetical protein